MEVDAPPAAIPSSATGSGGDVTAIGGDVTAPTGNIYLDPDAMQGVEEAERVDDLPPEGQRHDDQDVEMGQASTAGDQVEDAPPVVTFRRDPNSQSRRSTSEIAQGDQSEPRRWTILRRHHAADKRKGRESSLSTL